MVKWLGLGPLAAGVGFQPWELTSCTLHNRAKKKKKIVVSSSQLYYYFLVCNVFFCFWPFSRFSLYLWFWQFKYDILKCMLF